MSKSASRTNAGMVVGLGLVALGGWLLLERVLGPLLWPLRFVLHAMGRIGWPIALILVGILLLTRRARHEEGSVMSTYQTSGRTLARSRSNRVIAGVLAGFASFFGWSPSTVRLAYAVLTLLTGVWPGVFAYVFAAIFMPEESFGAPVVTVSAPPAPPAPAAPQAPAPPAPPAA